MSLTTRVFAGFVLVVSGCVLGAALTSQYWGGLVPCELCLLQRWPWAAAIVIAIVLVMVGSRAALPWAGLIFGIVFAVSAGFAFYHLGVEQHWFAGPSVCTASGAGHAKTVEEMKALIMNAAPVQCDQVQWTLFGVSLAGWNLVASAVMFLCSVVAGLQRAGAPRRARLEEGTA
ncbi:MAG TPA: disulfide bond formation protein B [Stellaceae bacterium]|nr:disulfide bond formation protein B [Stellaceae bacterium]